MTSAEQRNADATVAEFCGQLVAETGWRRA